MNSIGFPDMVNGVNTTVFSDHEATVSNLKLILMTNRRNTLFGDPYYGNNLLTIIFRQNNVLLEDLVVDEIYTCIQEYIPQLRLSRDDITLRFVKDTLYADISAVNVLTNTNDLYTIKLTEFDEV